MRSILRHAAPLLAVLLAACGGEDATSAPTSVRGRVELLDRVSAALSLSTVLAIEGSYGASCIDRAGRWVIPLGAWSPAPFEVPLTVIDSDAGCTLRVTGVLAGATDAPVRFVPTAPVTLAAEWAETGIAFHREDGEATAFYGNLRLQPDASFAQDFVVELVYSDDVSETDLNLPTEFAITHGTATARGIPAPDAGLSLAALAIRVNARNVVRSGTGSALLTQGLVQAESSVLDLGTLHEEASYAEVDAAFRRLDAPRVSLTGASVAIPAADFRLLGVDLTVPGERSVILANTEQGVNSYQVLRITVHPPIPAPADTTRPTVLETLPLAGASAVATNSTIRATFSEPMEPQSFTGGTFNVKRSTSTIQGVVTVTGATALFTPASPLTGSATYNVTIRATASDKAGNTLAEAKSWSFTTAHP